jgi:hypothetical protein
MSPVGVEFHHLMVRGEINMNRSVALIAFLVLEKTIPLPDVAGRIDHLAVDLGRSHLFVAELGNGSVDVVDLERAAKIGRISGLEEPQGVAYAPASDRIVVASGGDGAVRMFRGGDFAPAGEVRLGSDADNVRLDPRTGHVLVGYGRGGLAVIDPVKPSKLADIALGAHPEGFQLESRTGRAFVNVPAARQIAVVDLASARQTGTWAVPELESNFPLAIEGSGARLAVVYRKPPRLVLLDAKSGAVTANVPSCGDADDVFFDAKRGRIYVSCGDGAVDVFQSDSTQTRLLAGIPTPAGGRTSLFVPELDRLFVAVRAGPSRPEAAILVFSTAPPP